ncbi:MAG: hypothetical protein HZA54_18890 [Planctomycetes bacterium]|nr:hypothetical protein [Planctomycetota bacterium]
MERTLALGFAVVLAAFVLSSASLVAWVRRVERELSELQAQQQGGSAFAGKGGATAGTGVIPELERELRAMRLRATAAVRDSRHVAPEGGSESQREEVGPAAGRPSVGGPPVATVSGARTSGGGAEASRGTASPPRPSTPKPTAADPAAGSTSPALGEDSQDDLADFRAHLAMTHRGLLNRHIEELGLRAGQAEGVRGVLEVRGEELVALRRQARFLAPAAYQEEGDAIEARSEAGINALLTAEQRRLYRAYNAPASVAGR